MTQPAEVSFIRRPEGETFRSAFAWWIPWCGPALVSVSFLALSVWTWRKWPDLLVDFGRELYVPWQLTTGKVLYVDIAYFNGPLSPYLCEEANWRGFASNEKKYNPATMRSRAFIPTTKVTD